MNAEAFESKEMTVNLGKTKLMVSGMEEEMFNSKIDLCGMCEIRVMYCYAVLCTASHKWVHARCIDKKKAKNFKRSDEKLCDGVETLLVHLSR